MLITLPWIKLYPHDWVYDTYEMTPEQRRIYLTLILCMHDKKAPLKDDFQMLSHLCNFSSRKFVNVVDYLIKSGRLIKTDDGGLWSLDVEKELNSFKEDLDCFSEDLDNLTLHENVEEKENVK